MAIEVLAFPQENADADAAKEMKVEVRGKDSDGYETDMSGNLTLEMWADTRDAITSHEWEYVGSWNGTASEESRVRFLIDDEDLYGSWYRFNASLETSTQEYRATKEVPGVG